MDYDVDKEKLLQLKNQVEPFLNDLNKIVILNDMTIEDVRVLSEISIISNKISEIFKQYNINFLADSFNAIDLMINTTMFGNIEYSIALSYSMHLIEILSETLEVYFIGGILQNKTIIQSYQDMLFNWTEKNIPLEEKFHDETEIKDEDENIFKKIADLKGFPSLPENLKELNGLFINFSLENLEFIDDFISESYEILSLTVQKLLDIEKNCNDYELINEIFRSIHTIKGSAGFLGLTEMTVVSHWTETLLDKCRNNEIKFNSDIIDVILKSTDILKELLKNIQLKVKELRGEQKNIELKEIFIENILNSLVNVITDNSKIKDESKENLSDKNLKNVKTKTSIINHNEKQNKEIVKSIQNNDELQTDSIRIPINKLDSLYEMIGETLISVSILKQSAVLLKNSDKSFIEKIDYLDMLTDQLQMRMLKMRMFPIKSVYDKLNRQVRDLIKKSGKSVDFSVFGGETEVDKIIIDEIFAPLTHIIRNSMDHGLEMPDRRFAKGKNKTGMIKLKTENRGDNVIIEIFDDGSGLNKNKILSKAIEKQLIIEQDKLDDSEIYNFIFAPGFSTADAVTEIFGRGVGMDVVKKTIDKLGGKIDIETEIDKFTKITIT
ncbi:Hpt domain-containing protein, partial [Candidatus Dependentiae bacterium]|nr:Hpt domain-containing protein [Candidatus Dependentiae bacterium]